MRKLAMLLFGAALVATLSGCQFGLGPNEEAPSDDEQAGVNPYSEEAALLFLEEVAGLSKAGIQPDWGNVADDSDRINYGDDPDSKRGYAKIRFQKPDSEVTTEEYEAWARKVFDATATASDDGRNVVGPSFAEEGEDPLATVDFAEVLRPKNSGWGYCKDGVYLEVSVFQVCDPDRKGSEAGYMYRIGASLEVKVTESKA